MSWITRDAALDLLGVKPQTLYAYVSRGLVASQPQADDPRASLYSQADIDGLIQRRRSGRGRQAIAKAAISWGDPVMETAITTVRDGRLIYRGRDAVKLATGATLEEATPWLLRTLGLGKKKKISDAVPDELSLDELESVLSTMPVQRKSARRDASQDELSAMVAEALEEARSDAE